MEVKNNDRHAYIMLTLFNPFKIRLITPVDFLENFSRKLFRKTFEIMDSLESFLIYFLSSPNFFLLKTIMFS